MRRLSSKQNKSSVIFYAIVLTVILGGVFIITQEINIPTNKVSQEIQLNIEK